MVKRVFAVLVVLGSLVAFGWFGDPTYYDFAYIAYVNDVDVSPTEAGVAPEAGTVSGPLTVRVVATPHLNSIETCLLQYREVLAATWHTVPIAWYKAGEYSDKLLGYWSFETYTVGVFADDHGLADDLTKTSDTITHSEGTGMQGDCFSPNASGQLEAASDTWNKPTDGFAFAAWVKPPTYSGSGEKMLLHQEGVGTSDGYRISYDDTAGWMFSVMTVAGAKTCTTGYLPMSNAWHHVAAVANSANHTMYLYIDNVLEDSNDTWDGTVFWDSTDGFAVGNSNQAVPSGGWNGGYIDEVSWWGEMAFTTEAEATSFVSWLYHGGVGWDYAATALGPLATAPTIDFNDTECAFGLATINFDHYSLGDAFIIRLYVADDVWENADVADDTTAEGTNGWLDQWVVGGTLHLTNKKPAQPIIDFTPFPPPNQP